MCSHVGTSIVDKQDDGMMQLIARALDSMGVLDHDSFLNHYATTIGTTIYVPFVIGGQEVSFLNQICLCVHEHQHAVQYLKSRDKFILEYFVDSARRAAYEVEALRSNLEMMQFIIGGIPPMTSDAYADGLMFYACTDEDIVVSKRALASIEKTVRQGGVTNITSRVAIQFLREWNS